MAEQMPSSNENLWIIQVGVKVQSPKDEKPFAIQMRPFVIRAHNIESATFFAALEAKRRKLNYVKLAVIRATQYLAMRES